MSDKKWEIERLCELKERLCQIVESQLAGSIECLDTHELGEAVDMIKDFSEAIKNAKEACYYEKVVMAMEENESMGYNRRHLSNGQFASKGRGRMMGFNPIMRDKPYMDAYLDDEYDDMMGYNTSGNSSMGNAGRMSRSSGNSSSNSSSSMNRCGYEMDSNWDDRYGKAYNKYMMARRHYTETKDKSDKEEMDREANMHVHDTMATIRDIYKQADPEFKKSLKMELSALVNEMPT